jgi:hypothetical protein
MRAALLLVLAGLVPLSSLAQEMARRYGIAPDTKTYPQATAKEALASVLKAAAAGKYDYLTAQLADPAFVDDRVKRLYGGKFEEQVDDTRARLDPAAQKLLKRFLDEGKWTVGKTEAVTRLDKVKDRVVRLVRKDGRWYLEHRWGPPADE